MAVWQVMYMQFVVNGLQHAVLWFHFFEISPRIFSVVRLRSPWPPPEPHKKKYFVFENRVCQHFLVISLKPRASSAWGEQPTLLPTSLHLRASVLIQSKRWLRVMFHPHRQVLVWRNLLLRMSLSSAVWRTNGAWDSRRRCDWRERVHRLTNIVFRCI